VGTTFDLFTSFDGLVGFLIRFENCSFAAGYRERQLLQIYMGLFPFTLSWSGKYLFLLSDISFSLQNRHSPSDIVKCIQLMDNLFLPLEIAAGSLNSLLQRRGVPWLTHAWFNLIDRF
jgi:hypothetical protein